MLLSTHGPFYALSREKSEHKNAGKEFLIRPKSVGGRDRWLAQLEEAISALEKK